jgi:hypothetical protein
MRDRSAVCQSALDGNLQGVQHQISIGAPLDGDGCDTYNDKTDGCITGGAYHIPLGEAARMGHIEVVQALLDAGAPVDGVDYRNETALIMTASADHLKIVELLIARGANVNHVGCLGSALCVVQPGWRPNAIAIAKALLAAGASPLATASYTESAVDKWLDEIARNRVDKKIAPKVLELLRLLLPQAGDQASRVEEGIAQLEKKVGGANKSAAKAAASYAQLAKADSKTWSQDVRAALGPITKEEGRAAIEAVCKQVLATPAAIAHPAWPLLVLDVLNLSKTYADVTKQTYGKALPVSKMGDDEGGAIDYYADEHLYTFDWVLHVLSQPAATVTPHWPALVGAVCDAKQKAVGYYSFGDEEVTAMLAVNEVKWHEQFASVCAAAKEAFPYAACFGANGEHRDFPTVGAPKLPPAPKAPPSMDAAAKKAMAKTGLAKAAPGKARAKAPVKAAPKKAKPKKAPVKAAPKKAEPKKAPPKKAPMKAAPKKDPPKKKR